MTIQMQRCVKPSILAALPAYFGQGLSTAQLGMVDGFKVDYLPPPCNTVHPQKLKDLQEHIADFKSDKRDCLEEAEFTLQCKFGEKAFRVVKGVSLQL